MREKIVRIVSFSFIGWCLLVTLYWFHIVSDMAVNVWDGLRFVWFCALPTLVVGLGSIMLSTGSVDEQGSMKRERLLRRIVIIALVVVILEVSSLGLFFHYGC